MPTARGKITVNPAPRRAWSGSEPEKSSTSVGASAASAPIRRWAKAKNSPAVSTTAPLASSRNGR